MRGLLKLGPFRHLSTDHYIPCEERWLVQQSVGALDSSSVFIYPFTKIITEVVTAAMCFFSVSN